MFNLQMFSSVDWSLVIALLALIIAIREIRRNNNIIVKIMDCSCGYKQSVRENNAQEFYYFKIIIQNKGVNLYSPKMSLLFRHEKGGTFTLPLKQENQKKYSVETFAKGMITIFNLKSYEMNKHSMDSLIDLKNARKQDARLCLYSQNYFASSFRIDNWLDIVKQKWNKVAFKLSVNLKKGENYEGMDIVKKYQLPMLQTLGDKVQFFIKNSVESEDLVVADAPRQESRS
jgi:hypothetical protein